MFYFYKYLSATHFFLFFFLIIINSGPESESEAVFAVEIVVPDVLSTWPEFTSLPVAETITTFLCMSSVNSSSLFSRR